MFLRSPQRVTYISFATDRQRSRMRSFRDPTRCESFVILGYQDLANIGQCLDHLARGNKVYAAALLAAVKAPRGP
jgi:hypothetical protein